MVINEYKIFMGWLFDDHMNSEIPYPEILLKYSSKITVIYVISLFTKCQKLNHYLNKYLNNIDLWCIDKSELFFYIKRCVITNKIKRHQIHYFIFNRRDKLFHELRKKLPYLKNDEILLLCEHIEGSDDKESIYNSLGINKPKKEKIKKQKTKIPEKLSLRDFLRDNFSYTI